jgi:ADP-ribosylglycohydrolase
MAAPAAGAPAFGSGAYAGPTGGLAAQAWLYARRAPGNACLSGLEQDHVPDPMLPLGPPGLVNPESKGCGAVMRSAPFGLAPASDDHAFGLAARCAQMTHGHPTGYYAAGALAAMVVHLVAGESLESAVLRALRLLARHPGHEETTAALRRALDLADEGDPGAEKVERLGAGWIAEEALAIAVYCALATPDIERALLLSVNHSGDSDSTGAICGNLLGARHGDHGLPSEWLERVEGRAQIAVLADDFAAECVRR